MIPRRNIGIGSASTLLFAAQYKCGHCRPRSDIGPKPAHSEDIPLNDDIAVNVQKNRYLPPKDLYGEVFWMHLLPKIAANNLRGAISVLDNKTNSSCYISIAVDGAQANGTL